MNELKEIRDRALVNVNEVIKENKEKVVEAYELVMGLLQKMRKEGLLALEYEACFMPMDMVLGEYLIWIIEMICDGIDSDYLCELMTVNFMANDYTGIDGIMYYLYSRSMLMLQAGMNRIQVEDFFNSVTRGSGLKFDTRHKIQNKCREIDEWKSELTDEENESLDNISCKLKSLSESEWKVIVARDGFTGFDKVFPYLDVTLQTKARKYINEIRYYLIMIWASKLKEREWEEMVLELSKLITILDRTEVSCQLLD